MHFNKIQEYLFPSNIYCICCDNLINESRPYALCDDCMEHIEWANKETCQMCGKLLRDDGEETGDEDYTICRDCQNGEHYFDRGFTCMCYGQREREILRKYKFQGAAYMSKKLGDMMADRLMPENLSPDMIVAVPMQKQKQKKRGYNQAELLAKHVAERMEIPYVRGILLRKTYKTAMNKLDASHRKENVRGSYYIAPGADKNKINGKTILLIDDIYTTGSTVDECSKLLKEAGAELVYVCTVASGKDR